MTSVICLAASATHHVVLLTPLQEGVDDEGIGGVLEVLSATEPDGVDTLRLPSLPDPMPGYTLKLHMPPRASIKITQTIRHAAAKAVAQLGLEQAGLVRVRGWMALMADWQEVYTLPPEDIKKMPDWDGGGWAGSSCIGIGCSCAPLLVICVR